MLKKLIILFLATFLFVWSILPQDYYQYIGKKVYVEIFNYYGYEGIVDDVIKIEECFDKDGFGNCLFKRERYTMFLDIKGRIKIIRCEDITKIEDVK
jgi:hypothetical protein